MDFIPELLLLLLSAIAEQGRGLMQLGADSAAPFQDSRSLWWIPRLRLYIRSTQGMFSWYQETNLWVWGQVMLLHETCTLGIFWSPRAGLLRQPWGSQKGFFWMFLYNFLSHCPFLKNKKQEFISIVISWWTLGSSALSTGSLEGRKRSCYFSLKLRLAPPRTAG